MKPSDVKTYTKVEGHIRTTTENYISLGVAVVEDEWSKRFYTAKANNISWADALRAHRREYLSITSHTFVRSYLRVVAKELKRPFVVATNRGTSIMLELPKRKRLEPCYAGFLLAPCANDMGRDSLMAAPIYYRPRKTILYVFFQGDAGRVMFNTFLERCRTDPEYRKALRT